MGAEEKEKKTEIMGKKAKRKKGTPRGEENNGRH